MDQKSLDSLGNVGLNDLTCIAIEFDESEDEALESLAHWRSAGECPQCQRDTQWRRIRRSNPTRRAAKGTNETKTFYCPRCGYSFNPMAGTIFERSRIPLPTWYQIYILLEEECDLFKIQKELGLTRGTAKRMLDQLSTILESPYKERAKKMAQPRKYELWSRSGHAPT